MSPPATCQAPRWKSCAAANSRSNAHLRPVAPGTRLSSAHAAPMLEPSGLSSTPYSIVRRTRIVGGSGSLTTPPSRSPGFIVMQPFEPHSQIATSALVARSAAYTIIFFNIIALPCHFYVNCQASCTLGAINLFSIPVIGILCLLMDARHQPKVTFSTAIITWFIGALLTH